MSLSGLHQKNIEFQWNAATSSMLASHKDEIEAAQYGAYGISILLLLKLENLTAVERSVRGDGFDWWMGDKKDPLYEKKARLEVSGINNGDDKRINERVAEKLAQTDQSAGTGLPAFVVVVEFSRPVAVVKKK